MAKSIIPEAALEQHIAMLGKTGAGKSHAAQGVAEWLIAHKRRVCIIDPTDRYWGLRLLPDGRPSRFEPVIFGGQHADLPLSATHGEALAEIVGTTTTPVIIATRLMTVGERTRFFAEFAEQLLRKTEGSLHLVIDEAHLFAPQTRVQSVESGRLVHATNNLVALGRGVGLRIMLLSQRPAKLHKDALTQVETLVAFRLIAPHDVSAIDDWVADWADPGKAREIKASLPSLPTGTAWMWAPELGVLRRVGFPTNATYDSGKPLAAGRRGPEPGPLDLAAVRGRLERVAHEAVANDPRRLKARVAELEREVARFATSNEGAKSYTVDLGAERRAFERGLREGELAAQRKMVATVRHMAELTAGLAGELRAIVTELAGQIPEKPATPAQVVIGETQVDSAKPAPRASGLPPIKAEPLSIAERPRNESRNFPVASADRVLPRGERACLIAAAQHRDGLTRRDLTVLTGYKRSTRDAYAARLGERGFVDLVFGGRIVATDAGRAALGADYQPLPTGAALRAHLLATLPDGERRILDLLIGVYPQALLREDIGAATGYKRSTRDAYLSRLRARALVGAQGNALRAADVLFEETAPG